MIIQNETKIVFYTKAGKRLNYKVAEYSSSHTAFLMGYNSKWTQDHNCEEFGECGLDTDMDDDGARRRFVISLGIENVSGGICPTFKTKEWLKVLKAMLPYFKSIKVDDEYLTNDESEEELPTKVESENSFSFTPTISRGGRTKISLD